ncbi:MAG: hypothetical protein HKN16_07970 [Saprospiraceae bacterium]|nr:hypothetical protein [Saprospiraceae bacterium]
MERKKKSQGEGGSGENGESWLSWIANAFSSGVRVVGWILKPFLYLILFALLIAMIAFWFSMGAVAIFGADYLEFALTNSKLLNFAFVAQIFLLVGIPILMIILTLYGLLRNRAYQIKPIRRKLDWIWAGNLALLFVWVIFVGNDFTKEHHETYSDSLEGSGDPVSLVINSPEINDYQFGIHAPWVKVADQQFFQHALLDIAQSEDSKIVVNRKIQARGKNYGMAVSRAESMEYDFAVEGQEIMLSDFFMIQPWSQWRGQILNYEILLPVGQKVILPDLGNFIDVKLDLENLTESPRREIGKIWEMTENGLRCMDCQTI